MGSYRPTVTESVVEILSGRMLSWRPVMETEAENENENESESESSLAHEGP